MKIEAWVILVVNLAGNFWKSFGFFPHLLGLMTFRIWVVEYPYQIVLLVEKEFYQENPYGTITKFSMDVISSHGYHHLKLYIYMYQQAISWHHHHQNSIMVPLMSSKQYHNIIKTISWYHQYHQNISTYILKWHKILYKPYLLATPQQFKTVKWDL